MPLPMTRQHTYVLARLSLDTSVGRDESAFWNLEKIGIDGVVN